MAGPFRMPTMRLRDKQMKACQSARREAGFEIPEEPLKDLFAGRHPS